MAENRLQVADLIWPVFVREESLRGDIPSLPDVSRLTLAELLPAAEKAINNGLQSLMLFPVIALDKRDEQATEAFNEKGLLFTVIQKLKQEFPHLGVITDPALDPYTSHGQDGLVKNGEIDNDATLKVLEQFAVLQAQAGADAIAPSEMMDGRIGVIRRALDHHGYQKTCLISYAAKYASSFYSPFRNALGSDQCLGKADKKTYQMDPANLNEALREVAMDLKEGSDMVIIKPGLPYLDVIRTVKDHFKLPTIAYQVSGEYAMLKAAAAAGYLDYRAALLETMLCFKRAGCDGIITYAAPEVAQLLNQEACYNG
jgi:porphobilinogen synthase (EC 4.2.1.24)